MKNDIQFFSCSLEKADNSPLNTACMKVVDLLSKTKLMQIFSLPTLRHKIDINLSEVKR